MPDPAPGPDAGPVYTIEPRNKFFEAIRSIVEHEIRPGNTVSFVADVDLTEVERVRRRAAGARKPSYTAFVAKAVALALREFPYANRRVCRRSWLPWAGWRLQAFHRCDLAVSVERDLPGAESAVFMDILHDADQLSLAEMTDQLHALAVCDMTTNKQWREFSTVITRLPGSLAARLLRLPWYVPSLWVKYRGAAVMISSPAKYGVDFIVGSWTHPLGFSFGLVKPRPVVRGEQIVVRPTFALILNFDRRVMAGAQAARFFKRVADLLEGAEAAMAPFWSPADTAADGPARGEIPAAETGALGPS
jgi:pyruvate/2-oxoglutarate dehydrogenase complex dihydrolipoamide acyltransferase (E2) component